MLLAVPVLPAAAETSGQAVTGAVLDAIESKILGTRPAAKDRDRDRDRDRDGRERRARDLDDRDDDRDRDRDRDKDKDRGRGHNGKFVPPGLAKKGGLPPGIAKKLNDDGTLPAAMARREVPPDLARTLPKTRTGQQRVVVDDDVVLIEQATGRVLDVIIGAARGR